MLPTEETTLVALHDVALAYDAGHTVSFADITLGKGERVAIVGANASGKSTLCRMIARLSAPTQGRVSISDAYRALSLAYLPQHGGLFEQLTVYENLELQRRVYGLTDVFDPRLFRGLWELGLANEMNTPVARLSGGYARLTALAGTLATRAQVLILDEPFSGLDAQRGAVAAQAIAAAAENCALLVVTAHHAAEVPIPARLVTLGATNDQHTHQ